MSYVRPSGTSRFIARSLAKLGLPSAWLDQEFDAIYTMINGITLTANTSEWSLYGSAVTYVSSTQFTVAGDQTTTFQPKRRIRVNNNPALVYSKVSTSAYNGGTDLTTVTLADAVIAAGITQVSYGIVTAPTGNNSLSAEIIPMTSASGVTATDAQAGIVEAAGRRIVTKSADYTATIDDDIILVDASGSPRTITLLSAVTMLAGRKIEIVKIDSSANAVTIDASGAQTINGALTKVLASQYDAAILISDGTNLLIELTANATATPTINRIPIADQTGGRLAWGWKPAWKGALVYRDQTPIALTLKTGITQDLPFESIAYDTSSIVSQPSATITVIIATPGVVSWASHGMNIGDTFRVTTTGALPTGMVATQYYYIIATGFTTDSFRFSLTSGGAAVNTSGSQSGTHTGYTMPRLVVPTGITKVRVGIVVSSNTASGTSSVYILKNGSSSFAGAPYFVGTTISEVGGWSPILEVTAGDYFYVNGNPNGTAAGALLGYTYSRYWFAMEIVE